MVYFVMAKISKSYPGPKPAKEHKGWVLMKAVNTKAEADKYVKLCKKTSDRWSTNKGIKFYDDYKIVKLR